jgi:ZIP family zinc transporter/zinc and cadmium transporter
MVLASGQNRKNAIRAAATLGGSTLFGVALTSIFQGQLHYALPLAGGVTLYVAGTDLLPEVNRQPNWRMALLVFLGVAILLILQRFLGV